MPQQVIYTITANCRDCCRCVRECPVKAIRINDGQARIEDGLCIKCGTCVRECPQRAKTVRSDLEEAKSLLSGFVDLPDGMAGGRGRMVAASVAPSFAAVFPGELSRRLPSALRQLGFKFVGSTIIYSFMQAVGIVNDHLKPCFVYQEMMDAARAGERG